MAAASFLKRWARSIGLAFGTATLKTALYTVDGGQRAVIFDRYHGVLNDTFGEGSHLLIPGLQRAYILDARNAVEISISKLSVSKDHQIVNLTVSILSRPDVTRLPEIFKTLGLEYYEKILPSIGNEVLKTVLAQVYARELLTERLRVSALMRESLVRRAKDFNIEIVDVAITELSFGSEFSKVVEQTMVAEQEAEKSKFLVAKAELEMRAAIIRAEGESESAKIISDATAAFGSWLIELRKIEAAKDNAATFSKYGKVYMPRKNNMLLDLDFFEEGLLKKVMDVIKDLVNDVNFDCSATGFSLQAMDSSHVALVAMLLRSEGFKHYRFDSNDIMAKRLKCAGSDDIITIKAVVGSDTISFMFESLTQDKIADFEKKLMDINSEHLGIPKAEYHAIVRMPSSEFGRICEDLSSIGDTAVISVTKEGVKFSTRGDTGTANVVCKQNTTVDKPEEATVIEMNEPVSLTFALRYLNSFTKASPLSSTVTISLSSKLPVVVEYKIAEMGYIRFYLAPKIEEDGEETKP